MADFLRPDRWHISRAEKMILKAKPKLKGDVVELSSQAALLLRMHNLVVKHNLTPCVRSVYDRAAFQSAKSNGKNTDKSIR
jgi:SPX domain protein involved in polyphosphate accumulation